VRAVPCPSPRDAPLPERVAARSRGPRRPSATVWSSLHPRNWLSKRHSGHKFRRAAGVSLGDRRARYPGPVIKADRAEGLLLHNGDAAGHDAREVSWRRVTHTVEDLIIESSSTRTRTAPTAGMWPPRCRSSRRTPTSSCT
jgi:hypothetical protein